MIKKAPNHRENVAKIVLSNKDINSLYPAEYTKTFACYQQVKKDDLQDIAKNLKIFDELEKNADKLKVIVLDIEWHGLTAKAPGKKTYLLYKGHPMFLNNIKMYCRELKHFLLKHKHIKLYINNDICYGARSYVTKDKKGYKIGDLFEDYKTELDGVLDRVAMSGFTDHSLSKTTVFDGIYKSVAMKRYSQEIANGYFNLIECDDGNRKLYEAIRLLEKRAAKEKGLNIPEEAHEMSAKNIFLYLYLSKILEDSKNSNERKYYYFDKSANLKEFDKDTRKAKAMKNAFLGIKQQKAKNDMLPLSLDELINAYVQEYKKILDASGR